MADLGLVRDKGMTNLDAEAALLGALMIDNRSVDEVRAFLTAAEFAEPLHGKIYDAILRKLANGGPATPVTLKPHFLDDPAMAELGGPGYLAALTGNNIGLLAVSELAREIAELANRRAITRSLRQSADRLSDPDVPISSVLADLDTTRAGACEMSLETICMADLAGKAVPEAKWILPGWLPVGATTLLAGGGGTGKSLLVQALLTAISLGEVYLGLQPSQPMAALFVNCEDSADELHRRSVAICRANGWPQHALGAMHCLSRAGALENALGSFNEEGRFRPSRFFHQIVAIAKRHRIRVIALDNVGHLFAGNENIRTEVTQFVNACTRLALQIDGAVILLAHPAKFNESTYSGSTAWENAVRARWYLERLKSDPLDPPDRRRLTLGKANNAAIDATIDMAWHEGAFVPLEDVTLAPGDLDGPMFRSANAKFLECLDICSSQQRHVSDKSRASNYAPKVFEAMPAGRGLRKAEYAAAMERLLALGLIKLGAEMPWEDSARRRVSGIARVI